MLSPMLLDRSFKFQSQTGSQALSDGISLFLFAPPVQCFNPKREARPSQTSSNFSSISEAEKVSIPNGKPGPLRH